MPEGIASEWDAFLSLHPNAHLLQTSAWGALKSEFGWDVAHVISHGDQGLSQVGAQVLFRPLPLGMSVAYIPKGPVGADPDLDWSGWKILWPYVDALCRRRNAIFLKVEPDLWEIRGDDPGRSVDISPRGFRRGAQGIQPARTLVVNLLGDEDQILQRMKQKTRYNVRLALKKGVVVRAGSDLDTFNRLLAITGERDEFGVHSPEYYQRAYELFHPRGECELLIAEYQGEPLAALMVFAHGQRAWYFYGASCDDHRERMPTYLLQWEAMRWARAQGCTSYDLWGIPDVDEQVLEANFTSRRDGLWGVYRFKRGFGGELRRSSGPWDRVYRPVLYAFYRIWYRYRARDSRL
jgi:lipid II:glycine glycyltransferase (peptidoglycan interpeptide bridge formation enzyme)